MYYVYILLCSDNSYYTGLTDDVKKRLKQHNRGICRYTKDKLPVKLMWLGMFRDKKTAIEFERYLKSGSGKAFMKKRLI